MNVIDYHALVAAVFADKTARRFKKKDAAPRHDYCIEGFVNHGSVQPRRDYWSAALQRGNIPATESLTHLDRRRLERLDALIALDSGVPLHLRHQQARQRKLRRCGKRSRVISGGAARLVYGDSVFATSAMREKVARTFSRTWAAALYDDLERTVRH